MSYSYTKFSQKLLFLTLVTSCVFITLSCFKCFVNFTNAEKEPLDFKSSKEDLIHPKRGELWIQNKGTIFWFDGDYWLPVRDDYKRYRSISSYGPIMMKVRFGYSPNTGSPLVVTGETYAGDFVFFKSIAKNKIVFGHDYWGAAEFKTSDPVKIDPNKFYNLEISLGSLYPDIDLNKDLLKLITVKLNGKEVLRSERPSSPTTEQQIVIGQNHIGGNSCKQHFLGTIKELKQGSAFIIGVE